MNLVSLFITHLIQNAVYLNVGLLVIGARLDQVFRQLLSSLNEGAVAHVAFPAPEDLTD